MGNYSDIQFNHRAVNRAWSAALQLAPSVRRRSLVPTGQCPCPRSRRGPGSAHAPQPPQGPHL